MMILTDVIGSRTHVKSGGRDRIVDYTSRGSGEDKFAVLVDIGFYVAPKYNKAKVSFIKSGADSAGGLPMFLRMGGMVHAHIPGSYYFLTRDYKNLIPTK